MAATLKSSTMALTGRLRERDALLDETDDALQRSLDSARRSRARARQIYMRCPLGGEPVCVLSSRAQLMLTASRLSACGSPLYMMCIYAFVKKQALRAQEPSGVLPDVHRAACRRRHVCWDVHVHQGDLFRWL